MNRSSKLAIAALGICMAAPTFAGDNLAEFKAFLKAEGPKVSQAFAAENMGYFTSSTTPDFTMVENGKTSKKKEALAGLKMFFDMADNIKSTYKVSHVAVSGKKGSCDTEGFTTCDVKMPDKKVHKMTMKEWGTEHWVQQGKGVWKLAQIVSTRPAKATMDGKPFDMTKMAPPAQTAKKAG